MKLPEFRTVPVPKVLVDSFDYVFDIRRIHRKNKGQKIPFGTMSRPTAYRLIKRVMYKAGIKGKQATGKGLRHGFGVAMVSGPKPLPIHILSQLRACKIIRRPFFSFVLIWRNGNGKGYSSALCKY